MESLLAGIYQPNGIRT